MRNCSRLGFTSFAGFAVTFAVDQWLMVYRVRGDQVLILRVLAWLAELATIVWLTSLALLQNCHPARKSLRQLHDAYLLLINPCLMALDGASLLHGDSGFRAGRANGRLRPDSPTLPGHTVNELRAQGKAAEARAEFERLIQEGAESGIDSRSPAAIFDSVRGEIGNQPTAPVAGNAGTEG